MKNYRRYKFVKEYKKSETEKLPEGSELTVLNGTYYFNGGMVTPANYGFFNKLLAEEKIKSNYLREIPIPYNKV